MTKTRKSVKAKEPVKLRMKKLKNGGCSLYLDIYQDGERSYEFLKLYLVPETTPNAEVLNAEILKTANALKAQRIIKMMNNKTGIRPGNMGNMLLVDLMEEFRRKKCIAGQSNHYPVLISQATKHLLDYGGNKVQLKDVNVSFCTGFITHLSNKRIPGGRTLASSTAKLNYTIFSCALNYAVRKNYIPFNPATRVDKEDQIRNRESTRAFLSIEELRRMIQTPCYNRQTKMAFLFSCFCGLRISDIRNLKWNNISVENGQYIARITVKKTGHPLYLPLSDESVRWLPQRGSDEDNVFQLQSGLTLARQLQRWAADAGVNKNVTFHVARHTFATMMLTLGADLYTVSKLLGHSNISTTQIYAKIIDEQKIKAVNLVNGIFREK